MSFRFARGRRRYGGSLMTIRNWNEAKEWIEDWRNFVFQFLGTATPTVPGYVFGFFCDKEERSQRGDKNVNARLTIEDVETIRELAGVIPDDQLANEFGVTKVHIYRIRTFRRWSEPHYQLTDCERGVTNGRD